MTAPLHLRPPNAPTPPARAPETGAERRARHLDMLREMAELAMAVARDAAAKATAPTPDPDAPDPGRTFARAALRREIEEGIELELADDPEAELAVAEILAKLSEQLGLPFDPSILPDHFLDPTPPAHPDPAAATTDPAPPKPHPFYRRE